MKISPISSNFAAMAEQKAEVSVNQSFNQVRAELATPKAENAIFGPDISGQLRGLEQLAMSGKKMSPQELITFQVRASELGLRVQLVSKVAETLVSTLKRLQNPQ